MNFGSFISFPIPSLFGIGIFNSYLKKKQSNPQPQLPPAY
ncbi:hypothetical protein D930_00384 [Enterococcus faecalis KI-6-1-110608-1]|nr:hypothetical protein D930_00384 [Enterococcus faecalis KI-6-1-110608-1]